MSNFKTIVHVKDVNQCQTNSYKNTQIEKLKRLSWIKY